MQMSILRKVLTRGYIDVKKPDVERIRRSTFSTLMSMTFFCRTIGHLVRIVNTFVFESASFFIKVAKAGGRTWDVLIFVYFLSQLQRLRPLS